MRNKSTNSRSLIIMAVQIKTEIKYHLTLKTMNIARRLKVMCAGRQVEKREVCSHCETGVN